jgi:acetoin utilization protein AcuC
MRNALMYSDELSGLEYKPSHPFKPMRAKIFLELLYRYLLISEDNQGIISPPPLAEELLYLFHTREYVEMLKEAEAGRFTLDMLDAGLGTEDNPIFPSMYRLALLASAGTYHGAAMIQRGEARFVFNPVGGFHHAGKSHAEGFCYINDMAFTILDLVRKGLRVACIDIDVHHGNGTQDAFYDSDRVLTISLHESGKTLYPGSGFETEIGVGKGLGYNINLPLHEGTDDEVYLFAFESVVPPLVEKFGADIVIAAIGGDTHRDDPLAHLNLTSKGFVAVIDRINDLSPKILALGTGGYSVFRTAALWALAWAAFCGLTPQDQHLGLVGGMMYGPESQGGSLEDAPFVLHGQQKKVCRTQAEKVVRYIETHVFPIHGIR